jgi:hypothetical protein
MRTTLLGVVTISALLALYLIFAGYRAIVLLGSAQPLGITMGVALLVLPLIGIWALWRELRFGLTSARLLKQLEAEGMAPDDQVELLPSGRFDRDAADALFPKYQAETEANPLSWQSWLRLGLIYDACGDRRRARGAVNQAIKLAK